MDHHHCLEPVKMQREPRVVAIGNFDGVHRGHQLLLRAVVEQAAGRGAQATALTFWPHPTRYFKPDAPAFELSKPQQKARWIAQQGIQTCVSLPFDESLARLTPEAFVEEILVDGLHAVHVIVGEDFHFGHKRAGNAQTLRDLCAARGIGVTVFEPVERGGVISSTRIRQMVRQAQLERAQALLGRPFEVCGHVVHGDARGRMLGFPTANVDVGTVVMPEAGIYAATLQHTPGGDRLDACSYIGKRPTYGQGPATFETFVLDVDPEQGLDLYGKTVSIELLQRIRPDAAFDSSEALIQQMHKDIARTREVLAQRASSPDPDLTQT